MNNSNEELFKCSKSWSEFQQNGLSYFIGSIPRIFEILDDYNYYDVPEIAEIIGVSEETVRRWCRTSKLRVISPVGRYKVLGEDIKDFIYKWWRNEFLKV